MVNRRRARIVRVFFSQGQERLLELPRLREIASRFLGANLLPHQGRLLEGAQAVVGAYDLPRLFERSELQHVIASLLIHEAQVLERLDELLRVTPALCLRFQNFVGDLRKRVPGASVGRGLRSARTGHANGDAEQQHVDRAEVRAYFERDHRPPLEHRFQY